MNGWTAARRRRVLKVRDQLVALSPQLLIGWLLVAVLVGLWWLTLGGAR